jgi:16S rRNA (guanine527-N7)-methyltransferase
VLEGSSTARDPVDTALDGATRAALAALSARYGLSESQRGQLAALLSELSEDRRAPTAVRRPEQAVDVHLADSLGALELDVLRTAGTIADIGTGAGFPGLPLAVALTGSQFSLVESQRRRCTFVERVCGKAEIGNARVVCARVEEWSEGIGANDVVLARALAAQAAVLEYASPLLRLGGALIDWRGRRDSRVEQLAAAVAERLGLQRREIRRVEPFSGARHHNLHIYLKVGPAPSGFPRRAGMARKRPLAG